MNNYLNFACKSLVPGPAAEALSTSFWGSLAVGFGLAGGVVESGCDALTNTILPDILPFAMTGVEDELTTNAAASIPPMATEHNAVFYGIETSDDGTLSPRFFGSVLPGSTPNELGLYGADASDAAGLTAFNAGINLFDSRYTFWQNQSVPWWQWWAAPGLALIQNMHINQMRIAWRKGVEWFPTLDPSWQDVIGAADIQVVQVGCKCDTYEYGTLTGSNITYGVQDCDALSSGGNTGSTECYPLYQNTTSYKPNDGFILAESASNGPGNTHEVQFMPGSNHMQMRNDSNTADAMDKIFVKGLGGTYFITKER